MSANTYNSYNPPYQQSSAQQYAACQTAPASNNVTQSRQYQQPPTSQAQHYMPYPAQSYTNQSSGYDSTWNNGSYSGTRETTSQAAEVLRNMSTHTTNTTSATNQPGFTANSTMPSHSGRYTSFNSPQVLAQQNHSVYGQPRPHNVNNNRALPSPATVSGSIPHATQSMYNQQQRRSASPAQTHYNTTPASNAQTATMTSTTNQQYGAHSNQQLPIIETTRGPPNVTTSGAYNYSTEPMRPAAPSVSMADAYHAQGTTTVDPMAVYDPWPEYQRKQAAKKAVEDAARAEEERIAAEERKRQEEADSLQQPQSNSNAKKSQEQQTNITEAVYAPPATEDSGEALEVEIRAMMAKMRELNSKDPALLARIWEEERKAKVSKSQTQTSESKPTPQPAHVSTPQPTSSRENIASREVMKPATPAVAHTIPVRQAQTPAGRPTGNTIWPPEKKAHLANAAAIYLNSQNTVYKITPARILSLLNGNPSYIQLCEQLEQMNFKLDRAAFAKSLLTAVPDVNSKSHQSLPAPAPVQTPQVPPAVMRKEISTTVAPSPQHTPTSASGPPTHGGSYSPFLDNASPAGPPAPAPVAEMVPIKPELRKPANKEEAARKRNLSDLVDLTQLSEDEDVGPSTKRLDTGSMHIYDPPYFNNPSTTDGDRQLSTPNFPMANGLSASDPSQSLIQRPSLPSELKHAAYVQPLDKNKAFRRNTYNPATIARDVLLACGRHPSQRNLNQHLDPLRTTLPQITFDSDLSTIKWNLIDPGNPPPDYFKDRVEDLTQDADDEDDSGDEDRPRPRSPPNVIGGEGGAQAKVQALPEAINPFIQKKRRGRPPRNSLPNTNEHSKSPTPMSPSARPASGAGGVGYSAFRSATQYSPDGTPLPKKKGRPVGWRKAIHGSATAYAQKDVERDAGSLHMHQPTQSSSLSNVHTGDPSIRIDSRSPSVVNRVSQCYKCKWLNCKADLHNLDTLKKHVFKVHRKETLGNTLGCLWDNCGKEVQPPSFDLESNWRSHIQQTHFDPLLWELGDGPASGLSGKEDH
jgi:hypothetical protein